MSQRLSEARSSGTGIYFDGRTSARHIASVALDASGLRIAGNDGQLLSEWPYEEIESLDAPENVLRLGRRGSATLERLEISDSEFAAAIDARADAIDRSGRMQRRQRVRVIGWSVAATVSLLLVAYFGIPALADRLAPLVPVGIERRLGDAVDAQVRSMLDTQNAAAGFECGRGDGEAPGQSAFDKLIGRLAAAAELPAPVNALVVRRSEANAITLPGARVYVFRGLVDASNSPDELAGVIAHEFGHIAHRDGTKAVLQTGGLSLLFGMLLGDFIGGGAVVIAAKTVLQSSFSRSQEAAADLYGADLMVKAGGDVRAFAAILGRIGGATEPGMKILLDHPETRARVAAINNVAGAARRTAFLDAREWSALKKICAGK